MKKKIALMLVSTIITSCIAPSLPTFSHENETVLSSNVVRNNDSEVSKAKISIFDIYYSENRDAYLKKFQMDNSNIIKISNNGGQYQNSALKYTIDGNINTHWETGKPNSDIFKNEIVFELSNEEILNRIVYKSRNGNKGFAKKFKIYGSTTNEGDDFQLVTIGEYEVNGSLLEIKFTPTKFKRIKFVFEEANNYWAAASEFMFLKEDLISDEVDNLFTNGLMNEVVDEYRSIEKLELFEDKIKGHPLENELKEKIDLAKNIVNYKETSTKILTAEQHGDMVKHASENLKFGFGNNNQPTGLYAKPGQKIIIYLDAKEGEPLPKIFFSQQEGSFANWGKTVNLKIGKNEIIVPEIPKDNWYKNEVVNGGPIYIVNPYTQEQQSKAPVLRFVGGEEFPFLTENTNEEEFKNFLIEYKKKLDQDIAKNQDITNREMVDVFEFVSNHIVFTGTATGAYEAYIEKDVNPLDTIASYNNCMDEIFRYYGLDRSNINNDPKYIRENIRLAQPFGYMYAASNHIGIQRDVMTNLLIPFEQQKSSWGLIHEIGHRMDIKVREYGEVTNNMLPMYMSAYYNNIDNRIPYETHTYKNVISENSNAYNDYGHFERLPVFWQLEMYKPGYWGELNKLYRERNISLGAENTSNVKMQYLIKFSSEVIGEDLTEYFSRHGFEVNEDTKEELKKYPKPSMKIWYLNNNKYGYTGDGFSENVNLYVSVNQIDRGVNLNFEISDNGKDDLLGYEIKKDGEVIGFTTNNVFTDINADKTSNSVYEVIAYDLNLGTTDGVLINSFSPTIKVKDNKITVKLRETFNPMDYVEALSYDGINITSKVEVSSNVNTNKNGIYKVTYRVNDRDINIEKTIQVEVVTDYIYLSDEEWESVETEYGTPRRNSNIKGRMNGELTQFEKGFGIHANGKITYDLSGKNYDNFKALFGVDLNIEEQNRSSIVFKIFGDGELLKTTEVFNYYKNMVYVNVPVSGVEKLVIEVDDYDNGNSSDHAIIANPKLTINNSKPYISLSDATYKIGEKVDLYKDVVAEDPEDGNLTSNINISSNGFNTSKPGEYNLTYKVTDTDGNTVSKDRKIIVYSDIEYLSDIDWESARTDYSEVRRDKSSSDQTIKLTLGGQVQGFNKGIGTHANSKIVYNLKESNYDYFESYVGVDRNIPNQDTSSIIFKILADGQEVYNSGLMNYSTEAKLVRVPVKGVTKLELVVENAGNGNGFDHANFADAKFLITNRIVQTNIEYLSDIDWESARTDYSEVRKDKASSNEPIKLTVGGQVKIFNKGIGTHANSTIVYNLANRNYDYFETYVGVDRNVGRQDTSSIIFKILADGEEVYNSGLMKYSTEAKFVRIPVEGVSKLELIVDNSGNGIGSDHASFGDAKFIEKEIVSYNDVEYLSDIDWESARTDYSEVRKDRASSNETIKLTVGGEIKEFNKGIGTHANSTIVYNLVDSNYDYFQTYVGVDRNISNQDKSSIIFKILTDGKEVYNSGLMKYSTEAKFVRIPVKGVKKLELIVDNSGNGNGFDHANFADAKFLITDTRVYHDIEYLSDVNWQSAKTSYSEVRKDKASSNETIKLNIDGEVKEFIKGIGTHANSKIVYNLKGKNYKYFETYVGVDMNISKQNTSSIIFKVLADGEEVYNSGLMRYSTEAKFISISVDGVNTLELVVEDGGNGIGSDHASFGDAKFLIRDIIDYDDIQYLSDVNWESAKTDYSEVRKDKSSSNETIKLTVDGKVKEFTKGIGTHANSKIVYNLEDSNYEYFETYIGVDRNVSRQNTSSIMFKILADGKEVYNSGLMKYLTEAKYVILPVKGIRKLELIVEDSGNGIGSDHASFGDAKFFVKEDMFYNNYDYVTDYDWVSTENSYKEPIKDKSISNNTLRLTDENGDIASYERGIGAHSNSTIIYDLSNKNYKYFTSDIGVDRQMFGTVGSVIFQVYVDGKKKFDSGLMRSTDPKQYVEVDISGAKELKLVVTDGENGNGSDHATWADSKLIKI